MSDAKKLLIVEKSLTLGRCYQAYLSEDDYQVIIVRSGTEAIKFIDTERPHVVLLELELDDMKGNEVILHSQEKGLGCVFVVMTAQGSAVSAVDAMNDGALDYLEKPFTKDRLCITLKNAMDRYQWNLNEGGRAAADDRRGVKR
ncbi:MAG: hypothetical protein COA99_11375 [Moraxellaceae bacterium]|nr:MAG: hypothetical protein COA99_11375 [Moraxellaceae bacterium]